LTPDEISAIDAAHVWHPYSTIGAETLPPVVAVGAKGAWLTLIDDGRRIEVLDAMASWWTAIHGHGHPVLDAAITSQLATMNHVMFGGLTHEPAARLAQLLVQITPDGLDTVFFSDSGSVSVEVAVKMALQYWRSIGRRDKHRLMTWRGGYHGDTFTPMSVCDPDGGMHSLWTDVLAHQEFAPQVPTDYDPAYSEVFEKQLAEHADELAAVIVEPVVQGAGGMRFHDPRYLTDLRAACDRHRLRSHRRAVRRRARRHQPRHHVRRQGHHRRLHHPGCDVVQPRHREHHQHTRTRRADARPDVHGQCAGVRGRDRVRRAAVGRGLAGTGAGDRSGPARRA
jgi:adenosylmethionine-8-amino-7-oxononanoate aminotransferase